jgi:MFS family permease
MRTPLVIQGRVSAAADLTLSVAQATSIATGALLSTFVDYRILFGVMAAVVLASSGYLLTRREPTPCLRRWRRDRARPAAAQPRLPALPERRLALDLRVGDLGIAYPLLTLALTHSAAKTGYVGAVEFLPLVLLSAPAGVAADRFDRRRLMIAADAPGRPRLHCWHGGADGARDVLDVVVVAFVDTSAAVLYRSGSSGRVKAVVRRRNSPTRRA